MARHSRVFFVEEPIFDTDSAHLDTRQNDDNLWVIVPHLPMNSSAGKINKIIGLLLKQLWRFFNIQSPIAWYYNPMALEYSDPSVPDLVIYDCLSELSALKNVPDSLKENEKNLLAIADLVFTGGRSLYQSKKLQHGSTYFFPGTIDNKHFEKARHLQPELFDQENIPHPRIGFSGVIDERMDIDLLKELAMKKPDWHFILIGPMINMTTAALSMHSNIHCLGQKTYKELPWYISGWDAAMIPFSVNESTRYISPAKTPEYLAAGKPVIATPVHDIVKDYGLNNLIYIAQNADDFIEAIEQGLHIKDKTAWLKKVDAELAKKSWDETCEKMMCIIKEHMPATVQVPEHKENEYA
jgi:UDP-galactopyranose mutase